LIFEGLRGREPTAEENLVRRAFLNQACDQLTELAALKKSLTSAVGENELAELTALKKWVSETQPGYQLPQTTEEWQGSVEEWRHAELKKTIAREVVASKRDQARAEPQIWLALVQAFEAQDSARVREACRQSKRWLNPKWGGGSIVTSRGTRWMGRPYVSLLGEKAEQFVRASQDAYYPRRDSRDSKRPAFFARAMAGISCNISPVTAVHRLRKLKHGRKCPCVHCKADHWNRYYKLLYRSLRKGYPEEPANHETAAPYQPVPRQPFRGATFCCPACARLHEVTPEQATAREELDNGNTRMSWTIICGICAARHRRDPARFEFDGTFFRSLDLSSEYFAKGEKP
jgi:hypothetical protein